MRVEIGGANTLALIYILTKYEGPQSMEGSSGGGGYDVIFIMLFIANLFG